MGHISALLLCLALSLPAFAQGKDVTDLDLDDLLKVRVTSASKKEQSLTEVPAAIHVIRSEDIRRMGATTIAEALRAVPGLEVARATANTWAITSRGSNDVLSNKLLVLIDGRSVYSPLHSGVFWDAQDQFLEDIDRIEVIRGPGGSLWGANAVNGVINIITKGAEETQGGLLTSGGGTEELAFGGVRVGGKAGDNFFLRAYAKYFDRDDALLGTDPGHTAHDDWTSSRGGIRGDVKGAKSRFTFTGNYYDGRAQQSVVVPSLTSPTGVDAYVDRRKLRGGDFLVRWEYELDETSKVQVQGYYDYYYRDEALFKDVVHTADFDFQHRFRLFDINDITWGVGYRQYRAELDGSYVFNVDPDHRMDLLLSGFVQDEISLLSNVRLTLGSKFERNDYSGLEIQPSVRIAWNVDERNMLWASASRAVRTPSIIDHDGSITAAIIPPGAFPIAFNILGNDEFGREELIAYEMGYRVRPVDPVNVDVAVFYNDYDDLRSGEVGAPFVEFVPPPLKLVIPINLANHLQGKSFGAETAVNYQAAAWWLLQVNYSYLRMNLSEGDQNRRDPRTQFWLRSAMDLPDHFSIDVMARFVSELHIFDTVEPYTEADVRIGWRDPAGSLEAELIGQNLLHHKHVEFEDEAKRSELQRGVFARLTWRF